MNATKMQRQAGIGARAGGMASIRGQGRVTASKRGKFDCINRLAQKMTIVCAMKQEGPGMKG